MVQFSTFIVAFMEKSNMTVFKAICQKRQEINLQYVSAMFIKVDRVKMGHMDDLCQGYLAVASS